MTNRPPGGPRLARNIWFNFAGQGLPFAAAFLSIPHLVAGLGTERFGVLTLAWLVIGYSSLFDLGLGRALTQVVAAHRGHTPDPYAPPLVWRALAMMLLLGAIGAGVVGFLSPWMVHSVLRIPESLQAETLLAFILLALAIPFVAVTAGLVGVLSAFERFGVVNAIRAPVGVFMFAAPLLVLAFTPSLSVVAAVLVLGRVAACGAYFLACRPILPAVASTSSDVKPLFRFGAWMTVTNVISPFMLYLDRFVIGATLSVSAVAHYATPYEMVTRILVVPDGVLSAMFPAFAATHRHDPDRLARLFVRAVKYVAMLLFPVILMVVAFAPEALQWWVGVEFPRSSASVLRCLAIGVFINGLAQVFATLVLAAGRPDLSAKLHVLELPLYVAALSWAVGRYGILGAAIVWTGRVTLDGVLLFWLSTRLLGKRTIVRRRMAGVFLLMVAGLTTPLLADGLMLRTGLACLVAVGFTAVAWSAALDPDEREYARQVLGRVLGTVRHDRG